MKKYLFVGGKADGHMINVEEKYGHWQVPYIEQPFQCPYGDVDNYSSPYKVEVYRKVRWQSGENQYFQFFVSESIPNEDIMKLIFDNYKPLQEVRENKLINEMKSLLNECIFLMNLVHPHIINFSGINEIPKQILKVYKFLNMNKK